MDSPIEALRKYDYNLEQFFDWVTNLVLFQIERHGVYGYLTIILFFIVLGLFFKETRHLTTLILNTLFRGVTGAISTIIALLTGGLLIQIWRSLVSAINRLLRF